MLQVLLAYCAVLRVAHKHCCSTSLAPFLMLHLYACCAVKSVQYYSTCSLLEDIFVCTVINHGVFQLCCSAFLQLMTLTA